MKGLWISLYLYAGTFTGPVQVVFHESEQSCQMHIALGKAVFGKPTEAYCLQVDQASLDNLNYMMEKTND